MTDYEIGRQARREGEPLHANPTGVGFGMPPGSAAGSNKSENTPQGPQQNEPSPRHCPIGGEVGFSLASWALPSQRRHLTLYCALIN